MSGPRPRGLTLLDGMILVGGAAVGFAGCRGRVEEQGPATWDLRTAHDIAGYFLMLLSSLMVVVRLRRPRPPIRRLAWQPGAAACFAAAAYGLLFDVDCLMTMAWMRNFGERSFEGWIWFLIETPSHQFALIVPVTWMLLALGHRWRPEPGWVDRSGRILGWGWIAWAVAAPFR